MYLSHLSLCSGIGGLDLAAEWAGFKTIAQCEIDEYASKVLEKNFPGVPNLHDIRTVTNQRLGKLGIDSREITVISAGFPCQPYSLAGKGRGDRDERDLWGEVARVLGELRPQWFVGENTPGLFSRENQRYFRRILNDLTTLGYRIGWGIWGACDVGAPHKRERVFIMAYANGERRRVLKTGTTLFGGAVVQSEAKTPYGTSCIHGNIFDSPCKRSNEIELQNGALGEALGNKGRGDKSVRTDFLYGTFSNSNSQRELQSQGDKQKIRKRAVNESWWCAEPDVGRVAHGVPARVDKLRCLGNAVVPAQAYLIFKAIAEFYKNTF